MMQLRMVLPLMMVLVTVGQRTFSMDACSSFWWWLRWICTWKIWRVIVLWLLWRAIQMNESYDGKMGITFRTIRTVRDVNENWVLWTRSCWMSKSVNVHCTSIEIEVSKLRLLVHIVWRISLVSSSVQNFTIKSTFASCTYPIILVSSTRFFNPQTYEFLVDGKQWRYTWMVFGIFSSSVEMNWIENALQFAMLKRNKTG